MARARRLYLGEGCSSLFTYCTRVLHLSEHAAYGRIEAARAVRRFPVVLERLESGELTMSNLCLLRPHLRKENCLELLDSARFTGKRAVERLVAALAPQPDVRTSVRKLPTSQSGLCPAPEVQTTPAGLICQPTTPSSGVEAPIDTIVATELSKPAPGTSQGVAASSRLPIPVLRALAPERYKVQFTVSRETHDKLRRAQDLLRHSVPDGDPGAIFDRGLTVLLERLERSKFAAARRPKPPRHSGGDSRHIPANVRRAVGERDGSRCAFEGAEGRCGEKAFLEFHHIVPFARGGCATVENIQLRCRAHNQYQAVVDFGVRALFAREVSPP